MTQEELAVEIELIYDNDDEVLAATLVKQEKKPKKRVS